MEIKTETTELVPEGTRFGVWISDDKGDRIVDAVSKGEFRADDKGQRAVAVFVDDTKIVHAGVTFFRPDYVRRAIDEGRPLDFWGWDRLPPPSVWQRGENS